MAGKLAGPMAPGQFAQALPAMGAEPAGTVDNIQGEGVIIRADGTSVTLAEGVPVFQGDVIDTSEGSALGIIFIDKTTSAHGENARMVIDEFVFNPENNDGSQLFSLVQGAFVVASGEIAKLAPENLTVRTPTATIGVRGTEYGVNVSAEGGQTAVTIFKGAVVVSNDAGTVELTISGESTRVTSFFDEPGEVFIMDPNSQGSTYGGAFNVQPEQPPIGGEETDDETDVGEEQVAEEEVEEEVAEEEVVEEEEAEEEEAEEEEVAEEEVAEEEEAEEEVAEEEVAEEEVTEEEEQLADALNAIESASGDGGDGGDGDSGFEDLGDGSLGGLGGGGDDDGDTDNTQQAAAVVVDTTPPPPDDAPEEVVEDVPPPPPPPPQDTAVDGLNVAYDDQASGGEDSPIPLDFSASLVDLDGSETLTIEITDVPTGATLTNTAGDDFSGATSFELTADQLDGLNIRGLYT